MKYFLILILFFFLLVIGISSYHEDGKFNLANFQSYSDHLAVIVNKLDPLSVDIASYYQQKRNIPGTNIIEIDINPKNKVISPQEFKQIRESVTAKTPPHIQFYALTFAQPYRVGCMSITSAFAFGFDESYCANGCFPTQVNPYYNTSSSAPYTDFQIRPTMAIAATTLDDAKRLIELGVAADGTFPKGTAYLLDTTDNARNVRSISFPLIQEEFRGKFRVQVLKKNTIAHKSDILFYFTGLAQVNDLKTNVFLPGAIADHLTSFGGELTNSKQMSSLRWLEAGATGSYGTVVEPCNFPQKFPNPRIVMKYYLQGNTLIEAYWKSVAWPGQGIFIGEPLARPFY